MDRWFMLQKVHLPGNLVEIKDRLMMRKRELLEGLKTALGI